MSILKVVKNLPMILPIGIIEKLIDNQMEKNQKLLDAEIDTNQLKLKTESEAYLKTLEAEIERESNEEKKETFKSMIIISTEINNQITKFYEQNTTLMKKIDTETHKEIENFYKQLWNELKEDEIEYQNRVEELVIKLEKFDENSKSYDIFAKMLEKYAIDGYENISLQLKKVVDRQEFILKSITNRQEKQDDNMAELAKMDKAIIQCIVNKFDFK